MVTDRDADQDFVPAGEEPCDRQFSREEYTLWSYYE